MNIPRFVCSVLDPRVYFGLFRLINYYNYSFVRPMRILKLGRGCRISPNVFFSNAERIQIGERVHIGARSYIWAGNKSGKITISDDVLMGPEVFITVGKYKFDEGCPVSAQDMDEKDVFIGRDVWLGARVMVLPGSTIGSGAVIGAGAVVTGHIPPNSIAVGAPARVIGVRRGQ